MSEKRRRKILVIDGDAGAGDLIAGTLSQRGLQVAVVGNAEEGVLLAKETVPDLVFVSLFFPDSNGLKVSKLLHSIESLRQVPVVMLISYKGELDPKYTSTIGIVDVLVRPLKADEIILKTVKILGKDALSREVRETPPAAGPEEEAEFLPSEIETGTAADLGGEGPSGDSGDVLRPAGGAGVQRTEEVKFDHAAEGEKEAVDETEEFLRRGPEEDVDMPDGMIDTGHEEVERHPAGEDGLTGETVLPDQELSAENKPGSLSGKKGILALAFVGAVLVFGFGAYSMKKFFSPGGKSAPAKAATVNKEIVKEAARGPVVSEEDRAVTKRKESGGEKTGKNNLPAHASKETSSTGPRRQKDTAKEETKAAAHEKYRFSAQAGAFGNQKNADLLAGQLKKKGHDAFVEKDGTKPVYRVLVGRFDDGKRATEQVKRLQAEGFKSIIYRVRG